MNQSLYKSLALHIAVFLLLIVDLPFLSFDDDMAISQVPIIVDLKDVKISEMTNLPPKATFDKEDQKASTAKEKVESFTPDEPTDTPPQPVDDKAAKTDDKPVKVEEEVVKVPKDLLTAPPTEKPKAPEGKANQEKFQKVPPKKPTPPKAKASDSKTPDLANPLKSLLASVDEMEKNIGATNQKATIKEGTQVNNMGVEGGVGGSYFSELTISEVDAIAGRLRACWNLDPGAKGAQNMIIEIKARLNQDGSVKDVNISDTSRYNSDPHFRSVADSAKRAVYICAPYTIFAEKYADKYDLWNTLLLRFNPLDASVK